MRYLVILFFSLSFTALAKAQTATVILIENAWVKESPPGVKVNAGYMDIHNLSQDAIELMTVASPEFGAIEVHKTIVKNDQVSMQRHDSVSIPAESALTLTPGSWHLMLFRPKLPIMQGAYVELIFSFSNKTTRSLLVPVERGDK